MKREIVTEYDDFDQQWMAFDMNVYEPPDPDDGKGGPVGRGDTETEAIADLERLLVEMAEYEEQLAEDRASKGWVA